MKFEIFIITNRRSTLKNCISSVVQQTCQVPVTIIQNMGWSEALAECLDRCHRQFFVRIDDDFILHPRALEYMWSKIRQLANKNNLGLFCCYLWEDWTSKPVRGIKLYRTESVKKIGGFKPDKYGKIDKNTNAALSSANFDVIIDKSVVGVHACSSLRDQKRYEKLWSSEAELSYEKSTHSEMMRYAKRTKLRNQWRRQVWRACASARPRWRQTRRAGCGRTRAPFSGVVAASGVGALPPPTSPPTRRGSRSWRPGTSPPGRMVGGSRRASIPNANPAVLRPVRFQQAMHWSL